MKVSEYFLSDVLKRIVVSVKDEGENLVISYAFETENGKRKTHKVNKIILANKCKLWAIGKGFAVSSGMPKPYSKKLKIGAEVYNLKDLNNSVHHIYEETEEDSIISACNWLCSCEECKFCYIKSKKYFACSQKHGEPANCKCSMLQLQDTYLLKR